MVLLARRALSIARDHAEAVTLAMASALALASAALFLDSAVADRVAEGVADDPSGPVYFSVPYLLLWYVE